MSFGAGLGIAIAVGGALAAVTLRNILHAVFGLAISLMGVAGIFFALNSPFVAAMEVLIYVGGISVAMVFAVMLSVSIASSPKPESPRRRLLAAIPALALFATLASILHETQFVGRGVALTDAAWSVEAIGRDLLTHYNVVFEVLSFVLLLAIVGAITLTQDSEEEAP